MDETWGFGQLEISKNRAGYKGADKIETGKNVSEKVGSEVAGRAEARDHGLGTWGPGIYIAMFTFDLSY